MCRGAAKLGATGGDCPPREGAGGGEAERRSTLARVRVRGWHLCQILCVRGRPGVIGFAMIYITAGGLWLRRLQPPTPRCRSSSASTKCRSATADAQLYGISSLAGAAAQEGIPSVTVYAPHLPHSASKRRTRYSIGHTHSFQPGQRRQWTPPPVTREKLAKLPESDQSHRLYSSLASLWVSGGRGRQPARCARAADELRVRNGANGANARSPSCQHARCRSGPRPPAPAGAATGQVHAHTVISIAIGSPGAAGRPRAARVLNTRTARPLLLPRRPQPLVPA